MQEHNSRYHVACRYAPRGCGSHFSAEEVAEHESGCGHRAVPCPSAALGCGRTVEEARVLLHLAAEHARTTREAGSASGRFDVEWIFNPANEDDGGAVLDSKWGTYVLHFNQVES